MLFHTLHFAVFYAAVFGLYWTVLRRSLRGQNLMLLAASYYFYGCWDWRFLFLLAFSTALDYVSGLRIHAARTAAGKRAWLVASVAINLGFLGVFKYYDFFAGSFAALMGGLGLSVSPPLLKLILPVGISFYTFHGLSYVFDIYHGRIAPNREPVTYALFVAFFPLLVAGPIERATHLLPQLQKPRAFDAARAADGCRQILWGLFKKMVIADRAAMLLNPVFEAPGEYGGSTIAWAAVLFAFQIYGDFSGYSDIALGTARLLGIELLRNFSFPYFSRDIAEFWRRWHISLTTWFRDYLYIPLGGSRLGRWMSLRNTAIIFLVSGLWHGANWTFVAWGGLHALYFAPLLLLQRNRRHLDTVAQGRWLPSAREALAMGATFALVCLAWIFFRAESLGHAMACMERLASPSLLTLPERVSKTWIALLAGFLIVEWTGRHDAFGLQRTGARWPRWARWALYYAILLAIFRFAGKSADFIYFQF